MCVCEEQSAHVCEKRKRCQTVSVVSAKRTTQKGNHRDGFLRIMHTPKTIFLVMFNLNRTFGFRLVKTEALGDVNKQVSNCDRNLLLPGTEESFFNK